MSTESLQQQKKNLRRRIQQTLSNITPDEIARQSSIVVTRALELPEYRDAQSISIFLSMPGKEVSTLDIVRQAFKDGKKIYVPYVHAEKENKKSKIMDMLRLRDEDDLNSLEPDAWGIPSLSKDAVNHRENALGGTGCLEDVDEIIRGRASLDLIFMPAMAFDASLNRLGHGKGFYDRFLTLCQSLSPSGHQRQHFPHLIGLALQEQLLLPGEVIPTNEHDWKVDCVVTSQN